MSSFIQNQFFKSSTYPLKDVDISTVLTVSSYKGNILFASNDGNVYYTKDISQSFQTSNVFSHPINAILPSANYILFLGQKEQTVNLSLRSFPDFYSIFQYSFNYQNSSNIVSSSSPTSDYFAISAASSEILIFQVPQKIEIKSGQVPRFPEPVHITVDGTVTYLGYSSSILYFTTQKSGGFISFNGKTFVIDDLHGANCQTGIALAHNNELIVSQDSSVKIFNKLKPEASFALSGVPRELKIFS